MDKLLNLIGLAQKAGRLAVGEEPTGAAARARDARLILVAADAAENSVRRVRHFADAGQCLWCRIGADKDALGRAVGRSSCAMLAVTDIGFAEAIAKKLNSAIFPGSQGGPLEHIIAAKAVALGEALKPEFKTYQQQIVKNAAVLAQSIMEGGLDLVSGGTDNHLMLVDLRPAHLTGKEMEHRLDEVYITVNKNAIPNDPEKPFVTSGIRVGTPAATTRGLKEEDMKEIARIMGMVARDFEGNKTAAQEAVVALTKKYPIYE